MRRLLAAAREVKQAFASWRPAIESRRCSEHYEPYAEAVTAGELHRRPARNFLRPALQRQATFGSHVVVAFVSVTPSAACLLLLTLDTPPIGTTSTRLELGFSREGSSELCPGRFCP
jgi:hypothetical protein